MRPGPAVLVCAAALGLGSLTGAYVLPAGSSGAPAATPTSAASTASPAQVPIGPTPSRTPTPSVTPNPTPSSSPSPAKRLSEDDLLSVGSFADQSVSVTSFPQGTRVDRSADATLCVSDDAHAGKRTLRDITGHDPLLQGYWTQDDDGYAAGQLLAEAEDPAGAEASVARLVAAQQRCLEAAPGHWVLGAPRTADFSSTRSATWFGFFPDEQNTSGRAPDDVEPCGGTLLARNGARFTVVNVRMCLDGTQLSGLAAAASERLG